MDAAPAAISRQGVISIIFNPTARGEKSRAFQRRLGQFGGNVALLPTRSSGDAVVLAEQAVRDGSTTVVAAGGDGTVNEVLNGLARAPGGLERARLGVLPLGTVNVFAKELRIPGNLEAAWKIASGQAEQTIDLPEVRFPDGSKRYFVQMAGAGLDSVSIGRVSWSLKKKLGPLAYVWACAQTMLQPRPRVVAELDGEKIRGVMVCVGNGRFLGGRYPVFPHARLNDGLLDVVVVPKMTWLTVFRVFPRLLTDTFANSSAAIHRQVRTLSLSGDDGLPIHVEGDNVGVVPAHITLSPGVLRVATPS